jgi:hypothetical protein
VVEGLCRKIANVWPANYNCPGQIVISGEDDAVGECCVEAEEAGARRAVRLRVSGAFHSPLVEKAAEKLRPAVEKIHFADPRTAFMSTVTAKLEDAGRYRELLVEQLTAPVKFTQAAGELIGKGVTVFVEVGPGTSVAQRSTRRGSTGACHRLRQQQAGVARAGGDACLTPSRLWTGRQRWSQEHPAESGGRSRPSSLLRSERRRRLPVRAGEAEALAAEIGGRAVQADVSNPGSAPARRGGRRSRHSRQQRGPHPRRPARADVGRGLANGDRHQPLVGLLHLPCGHEADDEEARAARS